MTSEGPPFGHPVIFLSPQGTNAPVHFCSHLRNILFQQSSIEAQVDQFMRYYKLLSSTEVLRKAGLLFPDFWLHKM